LSQAFIELVNRRPCQAEKKGKEEKGRHHHPFSQLRESIAQKKFKKDAVCASEEKKQGGGRERGGASVISGV